MRRRLLLSLLLSLVLALALAAAVYFATSSSPSTRRPAASEGSGALWVGTISGKHVFSSSPGGIGTTQQTFRVTARLREVLQHEFLAPVLEPGAEGLRAAGYVISLEPDGTVVHSEYESQGSGVECSGVGDATLTRDAEKPGVTTRTTGHIHVRTMTVDSAAARRLGIPDIPNGLYVLSFFKENFSNGEEKFAVTCVITGPGDSHTLQQQLPGFHRVFGIGTYPVPQDSEWGDPEIRLLQANGTRMEGSYTRSIADEDSGGLHAIEMNWALTKEAER